MERFRRRFLGNGWWKEKRPAPCFCGSREYCQYCEDVSRSEICWFNTLLGGTEWDAGRQTRFIEMLVGSNPFLLDRGADAIWATVVLRKAYDVADWMVAAGHASYEPRGHYHCDEHDELCVPYDASTWRDWIERELADYGASGGDVSISNDRVKAAASEMVRRKYIKIPLSSGLPHYFWLLNGYTIDDFCRIYACIEYIYVDRFNFHEIEMSLKHHMDLVLRAKTGFRMILVMYICGSGDEFEGLYTAKALEKIVFMHRDRKESSAATKIQCMFRVSRSRETADTIRAHPDNLFHPEHTKVRQNILGIDAACFAPR